MSANLQAHHMHNARSFQGMPSRQVQEGGYRFCARRHLPNWQADFEPSLVAVLAPETLRVSATAVPAVHHNACNLC